MAAAGSSASPSRRQILIIVAGAFVLILLWGNLLLKRGDKPNGVGAIPDAAVEVPTTSINEMTALLSQANDASTDIFERDTEPRPLARDPFAIPRPVLQQLLSEREREGAQTLSIGRIADEAAARRQNALESMRLTATLLVGGRGTAILGGQYVHEGDAIEGFVVKTIEERSVVVEDSQGEEVIRLAEEPLP